MKIDRHLKNYNFMKKQMEQDIKRNRDMNMQSLKEHVAGLRYKPHISDKKEFQKVYKIDE
jgi:hypothetical protein